VHKAFLEHNDSTMLITMLAFSAGSQYFNVQQIPVQINVITQDFVIKQLPYLRYQRNPLNQNSYCMMLFCMMMLCLMVLSF